MDWSNKYKKSIYDVYLSTYASEELLKCRKVCDDKWRTKTEEANMIRYCPKCKKEEARNECRYGPKYWDMYSVPTALKSNSYDPNDPHPANEEKDHEHSMARSELSTIISAAKRLKKKVKGEGNIKAWVQSKITRAADYIDSAADYVDSGEMKTEAVIGQDTEMRRSASEDRRREKKSHSEWKRLGTKKRTRFSSTPRTQSQSSDYANSQIRSISWHDKKTRGKFIPGIVANEEYSNWRADFGLSEDWQKVNRQDKTDGLSQKAVNAYRRENPGSKLQTAVTEKKPKGKRAKRRKNFCSRMKGMRSKLTSSKTANDPDSRINKALRRWRCN
jgi:hypothetical protein